VTRSIGFNGERRVRNESGSTDDEDGRLHNATALCCGSRRAGWKVERMSLNRDGGGGGAR